VEDDAGDGSTGFEDDFAEIVGDVAEFPAGFYVGVALDERIEDTVNRTRDLAERFDPDGMIDRVRSSRKHLQEAHDAARALYECGDIVGFYCAGVTGFDSNRGLAAHGCGVVQISCRVAIFRAIVRDDDVVEPEREDHLF